MTIFEKRGRFCFFGTDGIIKKFRTLEAAIEAGGEQEKVALSGVPYKVDSTDVKVGTNDE